MAHQPGVFPQESCGPINSRDGMCYPSGRSVNLRQVIEKLIREAVRPPTSGGERVAWWSAPPAIDRCSTLDQEGEEL